MKFRVTCSMIYRLAPFLPSSLPAPDPSSCLPPPPLLSHAFWVKRTYFPLICFHGNQTNVLRLECVFVTHILRPKSVRQDEKKKERSCWLSFPTLPSALLLLALSFPFSLSLCLSRYLYLFLPFPLLFWPAAGNLIKQGVSWTIAEGERLVVAGTDKTSQDCGCLEWTGCGYTYAGRCVQLIQGKQCPAVSLLQLGTGEFRW